MDPITSQQTTSALITQFGLAGFVVVSCLGALIYVVKDLLKKSDTKDDKESIERARKDDQIIAISKDFSAALKETAAAIHTLSQAEIKRAAATEEFQKWLRGEAEKNDKAHKEILDHQGQILDFMKGRTRER